MEMQIRKSSGLSVPDKFYRLIEKEVKETGIPDVNAKRITLNFIDPDYSPKTGGYHPVNVCLVKDMKEWKLVSISDYAFQGFSKDLVKEIDICFVIHKAYSMFSGWLNGSDSKELLSMLINNFIEYYSMDVYQVTVHID